VKVQMQWGIFALLISIIIGLYLCALFYLFTRAMYRAMTDAEPRPTRLCIVVEGGNLKVQ